MIFHCPKPSPKMKPKRSKLGKRETERRSGRRRDPSYLAKVRTLPCCLAKLGTCEGRIEADHAGPRPLGRKCHDDEAIPMCQLHHWARTNYLRFFAGFTAEDMRAWADVQIGLTRARLNWKEPPANPKEAP